MFDYNTFKINAGTIDMGSVARGEAKLSKFLGKIVANKADRAAVTMWLAVSLATKSKNKVVLYASGATSYRIYGLAAGLAASDRIAKMDMRGLEGKSIKNGVLVAQTGCNCEDNVVGKCIICLVDNLTSLSEYSTYNLNRICVECACEDVEMDEVVECWFAGKDILEYLRYYLVSNNITDRWEYVGALESIYLY